MSRKTATTIPRSLSDSALPSPQSPESEASTPSPPSTRTSAPEDTTHQVCHHACHSDTTTAAEPTRRCSHPANDRVPNTDQNTPQVVTSGVVVGEQVGINRPVPPPMPQGLIVHMRTGTVSSRVVAPSASPAVSLSMIDDFGFGIDDNWSCRACTFLNHVLLSFCEMCDTAREEPAISSRPVSPAGGASANASNGASNGESESESDSERASDIARGAGSDTCGICFTDASSGDGGDGEVMQPLQTLPCLASHPFYCAGCVGMHLSIAIRNSGVTGIRCPHPGCECVPSPEGFRAEAVQVMGLDAEDVERYDKFAVLQTDPDSRACSKCGEVGRVRRSRLTGRIVKQVDCAACGHSYCALHGDAHGAYEKSACKAYAKTAREDERMAEIYKRRNTKPCPNRSCRAPIEKASGCNEMYCTRCSTSMCWSCGGKMGDNHFEFWNLTGCPLSQHVYSRPAVYAIKCGMAIGLVVGAAIAIPAGIIGGPIYGAAKGIARMRRSRRRRRRAMYSK